MSLQSGIVKYVLSGDSIVLKGKNARNGPPPERTLGLAYIQAPRLGSFKKDISDEVGLCAVFLKPNKFNVNFYSAICLRK
jgi:hypothetical protein